MKSYGQDCPVAQTLDILGDRWTLLIVRDLFLGRTRFAEFQASLRGIPTNLLGDRLKQLEEHGIVTRQFYSEHPPRAEYVLTDQGRSLDPILGAITEWGSRFLPGDAPVRRVHTSCGEALRLRWYCSHCEEPAGRNIAVYGQVAVART
jgi:DNA-binding HxlR family transcriptional regulator